MVRPLRIEYPGAWYHVMNRGAGRRQIVKSDEDRQLFLNVLGETAESYPIEVHAYSLLDNHYHLLIHLPEVGLSRAMRHLNSVYTQRVNRRWKTDGPLFRGRYKAVLVDSEEYFLQLVRYIHLNPVAAGICQIPQDHAWTSHIGYLKAAKRPSWLKVDKVLEQFSSQEKTAIKELNDYVCAGVPTHFKKLMSERRAILGSKAFKEWVKEYFEEIILPKKEVASRDKKIRTSPGIRKVIEHVGHAHDVSTAEVRNGVAGKENPARSMAIYLARRLTGAPQKELAKWFKAKDGYAIAKIEQRYRDKLDRNPKLQKSVRMMMSSLVT